MRGLSGGGSGGRFQQQKGDTLVGGCNNLVRFVAQIPVPLTGGASFRISDSGDSGGDASSDVSAVAKPAPKSGPKLSVGKQSPISQYTPVPVLNTPNNPAMIANIFKGLIDKIQSGSDSESTSQSTSNSSSSSSSSSQTVTNNTSSPPITTPYRKPNTLMLNPLKSIERKMKLHRERAKQGRDSQVMSHFHADNHSFVSSLTNHQEEDQPNPSVDWYAAMEQNLVQNNIHAPNSINGSYVQSSVVMQDFNSSLYSNFTLTLQDGQSVQLSFTNIRGGLNIVVSGSAGVINTFAPHGASLSAALSDHIQENVTLSFSPSDGA